MYDSLIKFIRDWYSTEDFVPLHEPRFSQKDKDFVIDAIDSTFVSSVGKYVDRFEKQLALFSGAKRAVATVNGTAALQVAMKIAGAGVDTEIITQPLTFIATVNAITYNGAYPVFVDVDPDTMGLSHDCVESFLNECCELRNSQCWNKKTGNRVVAILPMHTFGFPCRIEQLCETANKWNIPIIEDSAEAIGSSVDGKFCGTFGQSGIFSFNGNKTITCGGGGAIVSNDSNIADKAKHLTTTAKKNHIWEFAHDEIGFNYRMPNLNAALACAQLEHLPEYLEDKRHLANAYKEFFTSMENVTFLNEQPGTESNFWLNTVILPDKRSRNLMLKELNAAGIMCRPAWRLINKLSIYNKAFCHRLKNAEWLQDRIVNLPSSVRKK